MLTPQAEQHMREVALGNALNELNAPAPYASRVAILLPFTCIEYVDEIDASDDRPVHISERRRIQKPYVRATDGKSNIVMKPCKLGSGALKPVPLVDAIRELADFGDQVIGGQPARVSGFRWKLFGSQH